MKTPSALLASLAILLCLSGFAAQDTLKIKTSAECDNCKERIENRLNYTKGVKSAVLDLSTKDVTVVYDPKKTNPVTLREAIAKVGYDADSIPAEKKAYDKLPKCCQKGGMKAH